MTEFDTDIATKTNFLYSAHHSLLQRYQLCATCRKYYTCFKYDDLEAFLLLEHDEDVKELIKLATIKPSNRITQYLIDHHDLDLNQLFYDFIKYNNLFHGYELLKFMPITIDIANHLLISTLKWFNDIKSFPHHFGIMQSVIDALYSLPKFNTLQFKYNMLNLLSTEPSKVILGHDRLVIAKQYIIGVAPMSYHLFVNGITNNDKPFVYLLFLNHYYLDHMGVEYNSVLNQFNDACLTFHLIHQLSLDIDINHIIKNLFYHLSI